MTSPPPGSPMKHFVYTAWPTRVLFGSGMLEEAAAELNRLGIRKALVLSTPEQAGDAEALATRMGHLAAGVFSGAAMHTPVEVTRQAMEIVDSTGTDGVVSLGGGSTIGLGKAIALRTDLPQLAIPTTYAGSEMTPIIGQTEAGRKTTQTSARVLPETVIYDPELTHSLPSFIAGPSAMNAIAHAVEALYAENRNPITSMMAEAAIGSIGAAIDGLMSDDLDRVARAEAQYGAWLAATCLASVGMAIHHKICHTLGGTFDLNHGAIHCLMIPYSTAYNRNHAPEAMERTERALGGKDAAGSLFELMRKTAPKTSLKEFGLAPADLDRAADLAVQNPYYNPRPVTRESVRDMLEKAYEGTKP